MSKITKLTFNGTRYDIGAKASNVKLNSGVTVEEEIAKLNYMHDNHFLGIFVGNTTSSALGEAKTYYSDQHITSSCWLLAGTDLSELYAYIYNGTDEPTKISNNVYDFTDYESLKNDVITLQNKVNNIPIFSADNITIVPSGDAGLDVKVNNTHVFYINIVDTTDPGLMSPEDKQKLDNLNTVDDSNYSCQHNTDTVDFFIDNKKTFSLSSATSDGEAGLMSTNDKRKLDSLKKPVVLTESAYEALDQSGNVDPNTIYYITED